MKLPRNVDGNALVNHLIRHWGYVFVRQQGSHQRLRTDAPTEHFVTVPLHYPVRLGTFAGIIKDVAAHKHVTVDEVLRDLT